MKFGTRLRLKPSNDRGEFELDRARSKNIIAENSIALGHDTHNSGLQKVKHRVTLRSDRRLCYILPLNRTKTTGGWDPEDSA